MSSSHNSIPSKDARPQPTPKQQTPEQKGAHMCLAPILQYGVCAEVMALQSAYGQFSPANTNGGESLPCSANMSKDAIAVRTQSAKDTMNKCISDPSMYKCFNDMVAQNGLVMNPTMDYCRAYFNACQDK